MIDGGMEEFSCVHLMSKKDTSKEIQAANTHTYTPRKIKGEEDMCSKRSLTPKINTIHTNQQMVAKVNITSQ